MITHHQQINAYPYITNKRT